jgi:hypothetical protein
MLPISPCTEGVVFSSVSLVNNEFADRYNRGINTRKKKVGLILNLGVSVKSVAIQDDLTEEFYLEW